LSSLDHIIGYYECALAIDKKALSEDHPDVARDLHNIGDTLRFLGRPAEALPFFQHALDIDEKALGKDHRSTGIIRRSFAVCTASLDGWRPSSHAGAVVTNFRPGSQAERLDLHLGDRIVEYDGHLITTSESLQKLTKASTPGRREVTLVIVRDGQRLRVRAAGGLLGVALQD
jgi:tetratricopeptide (TPR) repeat protein